MAGTDPTDSSTPVSAARVATDPSASVSIPGSSTVDPSNPLKRKDPDLPPWVTRTGGSKDRKPNWEGIPTYQKLDEGALDDDSFWFNDPKKMQMKTYFSRLPEVPSLAETFNLDNLIPVIVKPDPDHGYTYVLTIYGAKEGQEAHFLWNEQDGQMWRFKEKDLKKVVDMVVYETYGGDALERQFRSQLGSWGRIGRAA
ncbi:hypothetical protein B0T14DRAFT_443486 [Immersiella caudata]|uniref:Uncharacterized protein n=1 Tax=Immersiella caudata TaxID=314043 RepID=A0AA39XHS3_9PEZI|nr:hypothetical protein B0T14DRAFT_443486 [Immersiella caudata]